ncbi:MAG: YdcF family protein [Rhodocyclaceae bacterium]
MLGLILQRRWKRTGLSLTWGGVVLGLFLCTPATVQLITAPLETHPPIDEPDAKRAQAIVILGGGQRRANPEYDGKPTVNRITLERVRFGAQLARMTGLPILVSGGAPTGTTPEAELMGRVLTIDFRQPPQWVEAGSLDTSENAVNSAAMLRGFKIERIALVTHAAHMRRAVEEFRAQGLEVIPAPMGFMGDGTLGEEFFDYLPNNTSAYTGWYAMHEWLGIGVQKIRFAFR